MRGVRRSTPRLNGVSTDRVIRAPRGTAISCQSWQQEAALRMLMNNLDPEVAERPGDLVVYGGIGRAARNWECFDAIVAALRRLGNDETLLVQSGKPVGVFRTHADAPRVLISNSMLVPHWATWDHFYELDRKGLMMYGQMTAGSWIYIGSQGIVQGTYETFAEAGRQHYEGDLNGRWLLTAGLGGMGGAQPLAAVFAGASCLAVECDPEKIEFRRRTAHARFLTNPRNAPIEPEGDCCAPYVGGAVMMFRRAALDAIGGFDERFFLSGEDDDISLLETSRQLASGVVSQAALEDRMKRALKIVD